MRKSFRTVVALSVLTACTEPHKPGPVSPMSAQPSASVGDNFGQMGGAPIVVTEALPSQVESSQVVSQPQTAEETNAERLAWQLRLQGQGPLNLNR